MTRSRLPTNYPRPLTVGTPVIIKLGPEHRQYSRIHPRVRTYGQWIPGIVDWICPTDKGKMEIRISRKYVDRSAKVEGNKEEFYVRVERTALDCYNFRDIYVIRRVAKD